MQTECDHCLKLNDRKLSEANCTRREELAFCEARPTPSLQCERFLMRDCEQARKSGEDVRNFSRAPAPVLLVPPPFAERRVAGRLATRA